MKNYINSHINLKKVPTEIKKTFYLDDDLILEKVIVKDNNEKLIKIDKTDKNIKVSAFWLDNNIFKTEDLELKYLIDLEGNIFKDYIKNNPDFSIIVRETVYKKLVKANTIFRKNGCELLIKIGYRPFEVQQKLFTELNNYFSKKYYDLDSKEIYKITCQYVSDCNKYVSPHLTGGAVDVVIIDSSGKELDMGCPINYPGEESNLTYDKLTKKQKSNRDLLTNTMISVGFAPLSSEWWHFSYGDPIWAYFYGKKSSLYSQINQ